MPKITLQSQLIMATTKGNLGVNGNVFVDTTRLEIYLEPYGDLDNGGVPINILYSFLKVAWKDIEALAAFKKDMRPITSLQFQFINGWDFATDDSNVTRNLIRDGGWRVYNATNTISLKEFMNVTTLDDVHDQINDTAYYLQNVGVGPVNIVLPGNVNQAIQIYEHDGTSVVFDYRDTFKMFLREQGKTYASYNLIVAQNVEELEYIRYQIPLGSQLDAKIVASDVTIVGSAPYTGMSITFHATPQSLPMGLVNYDFNIVVNGNNGTAEQIYEFIQWSLRQATDIDAGPGTVIGKTFDDMVIFRGEDLVTRLTSAGGIYIQNFQPEDTNRLYFTDNTGAVRSFPYVAAGRVNFNDNLQLDVTSYFRMFIENDNAADVPAGNNFHTINAMILNDADGLPIRGLVSGQAFISFSHDYEFNVQRGAGSANKDMPIVVTAIGTDIAQYVAAFGLLIKSTQNVITLVSNEERTYRT